MEQLLMKFDLRNLQSFPFLDFIVSKAHALTGNKFSIKFNGSKGYLDNITISCEGRQSERNNIIRVYDHIKQNGTFKKKTVKIFHSEETGVRVEI